MSLSASPLLIQQQKTHTGRPQSNMDYPVTTLSAPDQTLPTVGKVLESGIPPKG